MPLEHPLHVRALPGSRARVGELARSGELVESLRITDREFQTLASIDLPGETDRDGYVQLLFTVRAIRKQ